MVRSLSKKSECVIQSEIRNMSLECDRVGGINLSQGVCNLEVPRPVRESAKGAIDEGLNSYTRYDGIQALREAVAQKLAGYGLQADPNSEIVITSGSTGAFYCAALALLDPGDEVILFEPYYGYHLSTIQAVGAVPTFVTLHPPHWSFSVEELEAVRSPKTKGIMICTPSNPSGKVFSQTEIEEVRDFAVRHNLFVFTDEIYEYFVYGDARHIPPASVDGMKTHAITISGLSKTFSITGWRIGYCYCGAEWAKNIGYFHDLVYVCAPAPLQAGVANGVTTLSASYYSDLRNKFLQKRNLVCSTLKSVGFEPIVPRGGYYVLADIARIPGATSKEKAMKLLEATTVACVPGEAFYHNPEEGKNLARFCFAKSDEELVEACRRLKSYR